MSKSKKEHTFLKAVKNIMAGSSASKEASPFPNDFLANSAKTFSFLKQPCFIFGTDKKIIYANPAFIELCVCAQPPQELDEVFSKKDLKDFISKAEPALSFEQSISCPLNIMCAKKPCAAAADVCFLSSQGKTKYGVAILKEVSDKFFNLKNADIDIIKSRNYLQTLFSTLPLALYVRDKKGKVMMCNNAAKEILGLEETGRNLKAFDSAALKQDLEEDKEVLLSGFVRRSESFAFKDASGEVRSAHILKAPIKDESGESNTVLTLFEDITNRKKQEDDILRDRNLLQTILDHAPMAIYTRDEGGRINFWNKHATTVFEDTDDSFATDTTHLHLKEGEIGQYRAREKEILKEGKVVMFEEEPFTTKEGSEIMLNLIKVPLPPLGNNPAGVLTIAQDITEKYIQEQETFKTQNIIQTIFNNAPVAIYARDAQGELLFRNKKTLEIHGCADIEDVKESPEQQEFYKKREQSVIKSGKTLDLPEEEYFGPDGKRRIIHAVKVPVFDSDGKPMMVITIGEDVTETREKEKEILRSKNFLQEVIDNLPVALFAKKYTGEYILWNKKSEDLFEKPAEEVIGKTHHNDEINPEQEEFIRMQEQKVFDVGSEVDIPQELISTQKEGIKIMHTVKTPLFYEDGTPNCLLGISEDITAKSKMERQIYEAKTKYSILVENSREGILLIEQGKISFANKTVLAALGYNEGDLDGKTFSELAAREHVAAANDFYEKVLAGTAARDFAVIKLQNKNRDEVVEFEISAASAKYLGKKILIMFLRNITKEHRIETAVKTKDDKFRQAFENAKTPFVLLQNNGYVYEMNLAARDIFGLTKEDKPLYGSIYIKPGLPLSARKAMENLDSCVFDAKINFDKLKQTLPGIVKSGVLNLGVSMSPVNERQLANGRVAADYLMEITQKTTEEEVSSHTQNGVLGDDILAYQDAVLLCDRNGIVLKCNVQAEKLFDLNFTKIQGRMLTMFFSQSDTASIESDIKEVYGQNSIKSRFYNLKTAGGIIPVEASAALAKNNNFLISLRNNTARQQLIDTLRERSQYMQALYTVADIPILECEIKDGAFLKFENVNNPACLVTGYTRSELLGLSLADFLTGKNKKEAKKVQLYLAAKTEQLKRDKVIYFEANLQVCGKNILALVRISYFDVLGKQKALITVRDSTKEKVLANELEYKEKELAGIKDALPGLYLKVDKRGYIQEYKTTDMTYNISVFPTDFVNKNPYEYLSKETADSLLESLKEALKTDIPVHTSFSMQYGSEHRFYEASISRIKGEDNAVVLVKAVDRRKGITNKIHQLYAFSSNKENSFVDKMSEILEFGKQIFAADVGIICHFSGNNKDKVLINYATKNEHNIIKGIETPVDECFASVRAGNIFTCFDTSTLECKDCLHTQRNINSIISAPLYVDGDVEGAICFLTVGKNRISVTEEDKNFMGFMGGLMGLALELRQSKKAVDNSLSTVRKLVSSLDMPACITDRDLGIKNLNEVMCSILGVYDISEVEGKNIFTRFALDALKAEGDFRSAQRTSKGGSFDFSFDIVAADGRPVNLLWHIVEIRDGKSKVRGLLMVSESVKDMERLVNLMPRPFSHI